MNWAPPVLSSSRLYQPLWSGPGVDDITEFYCTSIPRIRLTFWASDPSVVVGNTKSQWMEGWITRPVLGLRPPEEGAGAGMGRRAQRRQGDGRRWSGGH